MQAAEELLEISDYLLREKRKNIVNQLGADRKKCLRFKGQLG
jgi:hypothetical protein